MTASPQFVGRVLEASATAFLVGCRVPQLQESRLAFGALVRVAPSASEAPATPEIFGIISEIRLPGDNLVRQLTIAPELPPSIHADQHQRNLPVEISVLSLGYRTPEGRVAHLLPPRPPLTLANLYLCSPAEVREFTSAGRLGYFRHILRADVPADELLAVHFRQAREAHAETGDAADWVAEATRRLITLLRDDYDRLSSVLDALGEVVA